jgi:hypothetical protein
MKYGFVACNHPGDEGGHTGDNVLAGRWQNRGSSSTRSTAIAVREDANGGSRVSQSGA